MSLLKAFWAIFSASISSFRCADLLRTDSLRRTRSGPSRGYYIAAAGSLPDRNNYTYWNYSVASAPMMLMLFAEPRIGCVINKMTWNSGSSSSGRRMTHWGSIPYSQGNDASLFQVMLHVHDMEIPVKQRLRPRPPGAHNIRRRVLTIFLLEIHLQRTPLANILCSI